MTEKQASPVLLLDIGNTRTKWVFIDLEKELSTIDESNSGAIAHVEISDTSKNKALAQSVFGNHGITQQIVCVSVAGSQITEQWQSICKALWPNSKWHPFKSSKDACGVSNHYAAPNSLGADRWAAIIGAKNTNPNKEILIVNAGTATTIDRVDAQGNFMGGWIIPGLSMMLASLASGTADLPNLSPNASDSNQLGFGQSTRECITQGCIQSQIGAIVRAAELLPPSSRIILSGGNSDYLHSQLADALKNKHELILDKHVVLRGLQTWVNQTGHEKNI